MVYIEIETVLFCQKPGEEQQEIPVSIPYDPETDRKVPVTELFKKFAHENNLGNLNGFGLLDFSE